jgi:hypothetical protein
MSFDPRSRERLEALGRQLPRKLPAPEPARPTAAALPPSAAGGLHPVETEQDPERLFRELMDVSPDGTVPPHLMDRLRQLETQRQPPSSGGAPAPEAPSRNGVRKNVAAPRRPGPSVPRRPLAGGEHQDLYTAFQQLLLEDEEPD